MPHASAIVHAWQDAANRQDVERLIALSAPDIEIAGPRGSGVSHQILRAWLARAGVHLETRRVFSRGNSVVIAQHGVWRSAETGDVIGEQDIASRFRVDEERIYEPGLPRSHEHHDR